MQGSICVYFFLGNLISEFEFEHVSHDNASFERLNWCIRNTGHGYSVYPLSSKMWSTLVISWFITPSNLTIVVTATNPSYCSYLAQLNAIKRGPHIVELHPQVPK